MSNAGRPRLLDEVKKQEVCALIAAGCSLRYAARYVGCSASTIRREAERDAEFDERLRKSQLTAKLEPLRALRQKAATHWRAAAWLLERVDPEQFVRFDHKMYRPEEVADLLEHIRAALDDHLVHLPSKVIAVGILQKAIDDARLPKRTRHAHAKLDELTIGFPDLIASFENEELAVGD